MAKQTIDPKKAPILWDTVNEAFSKINDNFTELYLSVGGSGSPVDLSNLSSNISPSSSNTFDLGSETKRWRDLYLSGSSLHIGDAVVTSSGAAVNLPPGSTVGGSLIKDPIDGAFKTVSVSGEDDIVADNTSDTLNVIGVGISITTDPSSDSVTFTNSGVTKITGTGITVSGDGTGDVDLINEGVTSISVTPGNGISVTNGGVGDVVVANTGVITLTGGGGGIQIINVGNGEYSIRNNQPLSDGDFWTNIVVGATTIVADGNNDTLTFSSSEGISLSANAVSGTITITNTGVTSLGDGDGITVTNVGGSYTVTNSGVTELIAGSGISVSQSTGPVTINNTRVGFTSIAVQGQSPILADNTTDTLVLIAGQGVEFLSDPTTDSITISANANLESNLYGIDSTLLVDAENSQIVGDINTARLRTTESTIALGLVAGETNQGINTIAIGAAAGQANQGISSIAIGGQAGSTGQGVSAVALGTQAGATNQGAIGVAIGTLAGTTNQGLGAVAVGGTAGNDTQGQYAVALGYLAGATNQPANSIVINASGSGLNGSAAGFFVNPIREISGPQVLYYNPTDKEVTWGPVPSGGVSGGGGDYTFNIAADDSTQRVILSGETVKFIGAAGITTASDGEGNVTITGPNLSGYATTSSLAAVATSGEYDDLSGAPLLATVATSGSYNDLNDTPPVAPSRTQVNASTTNIAVGITENINITGYKGYLLYKIQTSSAAWVRIYTDNASRTADASRDELTDPLPGAGVIAEVITTGAETILISPGTFGYNNESTPTTSIPISVKNKGGSSASITVTLTVLQVEA